MTKVINLNEKEKFSLNAKLNQAVDTCKEKCKKVEEALSKSQKDLETSMAKIATSLNSNFLFTMKNPVFTWSDKLKGHKIKITNSIAEQTGMESSGQRFIMIEPSLNSYGSKAKMRWGIRVIKFVGWIGVGICLKNIITKANYHFNYNNIGHGSYLISSNGYSWSHSVK